MFPIWDAEPAGSCAEFSHPFDVSVRAAGSPARCVGWCQMDESSHGKQLTWHRLAKLQFGSAIRTFLLEIAMTTTLVDRSERENVTFPLTPFPVKIVWDTLHETMTSPVQMPIAFFTPTV